MPHPVSARLSDRGGCEPKYSKAHAERATPLRLLEVRKTPRSRPRNSLPQSETNPELERIEDRLEIEAPDGRTPANGLDMAKSKSDRSGNVRVGCAGWSLPLRAQRPLPRRGHAPRSGTPLASPPSRSIPRSTGRIARRPTPAGPRLSLMTSRSPSRLPRVATHERRLENANDVLDGFLAEATQLGDRLGPLLVQLPPSLSFSEDIADEFFASLRDRFDGAVALEPRHASCV